MDSHDGKNDPRLKYIDRGLTILAALIVALTLSMVLDV